VADLLAGGTVSLENIGKVYRREDQYEIILQNCSFDIPEGKLTVLIGPSGCGKTTLIKLIAGYEPPTLGSVTLEGVAITGPGPDRCVVFQPRRRGFWRKSA